jgi:hypothetical protein
MRELRRQNKTGSTGAKLSAHHLSDVQFFITVTALVWHQMRRMIMWSADHGIWLPERISGLQGYMI